MIIEPMVIGFGITIATNLIGGAIAYGRVTESFDKTEKRLKSLRNQSIL